MTQSGDCLDALGPELSGVDRTVVALDGLREAQPQVSDPARTVSDALIWYGAVRMRAYGGCAKGMLRKLETEPLVIP